MLKRQDSFLSSSSRRENRTPPPPSTKPQPAKPVGCMTGILRIFSKFHLHRRRKFLTFGDNKQANAKPSEAKHGSVLPKSDENKSPVDDEEVGEVIIGAGGGGFSCEIPRSPSLAPEIRRAKSQDFITVSSTPPPARSLQERKNTLQPAEMISSSAEKRRKLLDALDKCDHDLKALKKIIQSVQFEDQEEYNTSPTSMTKSTSAWPWALVTTPSAAAAKKHSSLSNNSSIYSRRHSTATATAMTGRMTTTQQHKLSIWKKQDDLDASFMKKFMTEVLFMNSRYKPTRSSSWSSKAMIESVEEVCGDIEWGEKREVKRLGLELQDFICRDLIEEIVKDFGYFSIYSLRFQACRRKLQF